VYLTDEQWGKIEPLIPKRPVGPKGGRPRTDDRLVFEGILWVLKTGARMERSSEPVSKPFPSIGGIGVASENGTKPTFLRTCGVPFSQSWTTKASSIGMRCSWVQASFLQKRGARESEKPSGERDRSAWYLSMARVFLSEAIPIPRPAGPRRLRSLSLIRLLERSESQNEDPEDHEPDQSE